MPEVRNAPPLVEELDHEVKFVLPTRRAGARPAFRACWPEELHPGGFDRHHLLRRPHALLGRREARQ
ncbi:MAG: hypothetical protein R2862_13160 [Thermoanaerobaculia bacterium]